MSELLCIAIFVPVIVLSVPVVVLFVPVVLSVLFAPVALFLLFLLAVQVFFFLVLPVLFLLAVFSVVIMIDIPDLIWWFVTSLVQLVQLLDHTVLSLHTGLDALMLSLGNRLDALVLSLRNQLYALGLSLCNQLYALGESFRRTNILRSAKAECEISGNQRSCGSHMCLLIYHWRFSFFYSRVVSRSAHRAFNMSVDQRIILIPGGEGLIRRFS
ncbi:hypothetical protein FIBSPDRAFT_510161 [Athelia psychrophila]|uniref:Uncharacterized protein n=1 Tax=Athelia psychrophila TaxID=1759441 RepID=A0A167TLW1_9AGAM|nr:hypothetical protein FIBSPDRAFT_510161 [Fibularhizoctonia sp. CBS 109695]